MSSRPFKLRIEALENRCLLAVLSFDSAATGSDLSTGVAQPASGAIVTDDDGCGAHFAAATAVASPSAVTSTTTSTSTTSFGQPAVPDYAALYSALHGHGGIGDDVAADGGSHSSGDMADSAHDGHEIDELFGANGSSLSEMHSAATYHGTMADDRNAVSHVDIMAAGGRAMVDGRAVDSIVAGFGNAIDESSAEFAGAGGGMIGAEGAGDSMHGGSYAAQLAARSDAEGAAKSSHMDGENAADGNSVESLVAGWSHFDITPATTHVDPIATVEPAAQLASETPVEAVLVEATDIAFADPHLVVSPPMAPLADNATTHQAGRGMWPALTAAVLAVASTTAAYLLERRARKSVVANLQSKGALEQGKSRDDEPQRPIRTSPHRIRRAPHVIRPARTMNVGR